MEGGAFGFYNIFIYEDAGNNTWTLPDASYKIYTGDILGNLAQSSWSTKGLMIFYSFPEYPF